jgi:hypothetical protein
MAYERDNFMLLLKKSLDWIWKVYWVPATIVTGIPFGTQLGAYRSVGATFTGDQGLLSTCRPFTFTDKE